MVSKDAEYLRELVHDTTSQDVPPTYDSLFPAPAPSTQASESTASTIIYTPPPSDADARSSASLSPPPSPHGAPSILSVALSFSHRAPPPTPPPPPRLPSPIAIPQLTKSPVTPFARAWAPTLAAHDVTMPEFLGFIDNLNVVVAAGSGSERAAVFLAEANKAFFAPRGLHAEICDEAGLREVLRGGDGDEAPGAIVGPFAGLAVGEEAPAGPALGEAERRLSGLRGRVAELEMLGLPAPAGQSVLLARLCAEQSRGGGKWERRLAKETRRAVEVQGEGGTLSWKAERRLDRLEHRSQREAHRETRRADKKALKGVVKAEKERVKEIIKAGKDDHKELSKYAKQQAKLHVSCAKDVIRNSRDARGVRQADFEDPAFWLVVWGV